MRTISTGAGLCVLGVCVLGAAALSSPRLGNSATAASGRAPVPSIPQAAASPQMLPQRGMSANIDGTGLPLDASVPLNSGRTPSGTCEDLEPDIWFTAVHPIDGCVDRSTGEGRTFGSRSDFSHDFNGDGEEEFISPLSNPVPINAETPSVAGILFRDEVLFDGSSTSFRWQKVMTAAPLLSFFQSQPGMPSNWRLDFYYIQGWRDMDHDGDIDVILYCAWRTADGDTNGRLLWVENTGFQHAPPTNPYDHDGDGHVNTADLSLLLMEFTD